jgi:hypothetical protein
VTAAAALIIYRMDDEEESLIKKDNIVTKDQPKDEAGLFLAISFSKIAQ